MKMNLFFKSIRLKSRALWRSWKDRHNIHLMDDVMYNGIRCVVSNGNKYTSDNVHLWDLHEKTAQPDGSCKHYCVPEGEFRRMHTWFNFKNDRLYIYKWWHMCWYNILMDE